MIRRNQGDEVPRRLLRVSRRQGRSRPTARPRRSRGAAASTPAEAAGDVSRRTTVARALAFWVTAVRELLEESGVLLACDDAGRPDRRRDAARASSSSACRKALMAGERRFPSCSRAQGWHCDLAAAALPLALHHARLEPDPLHRALLPVPRARRPGARASSPRRRRRASGSTPARATAASSPARWRWPSRRSTASATSRSSARVDELWAAHADGREKFHGIVDRIESLEGLRLEAEPVSRPRLAKTKRNCAAAIDFLSTFSPR